jgi:hypothetical protein
MKKLFSYFAILSFITISSSCKKEISLTPDNTNMATTLSDTTLYTYPNGYNVLNAISQPISFGIPAYLELKNDIIDSTFLSTINTALPNESSVVLNHPGYLTTVNVINITNQSDIYVTFVLENTNNKNTLAYYTYPTKTPTTATHGGAIKGAMDTIKYIFPNTNSDQLNSGLLQGSKVKLGTFKVGTSIAFILILNGWNGKNVNFDNTKFYSQDNLNNNSKGGLKRHSVMLYNGSYNRFVIGFEWQDYVDATPNNDFDDLVFYVSSNVVNSISTKNVSPMVSPTN